jgi:hypothetical protein
VKFKSCTAASNSLAKPIWANALGTAAAWGSALWVEGSSWADSSRASAGECKFKSSIVFLAHTHQGEAAPFKSLKNINLQTKHAAKNCNAAQREPKV